MVSETIYYEKRFASVNGKEIAYIEESSGALIALLHGNPTHFIHKDSPFEICQAVTNWLITI